jgi:hypothetical protein
MIKSTSKSTVRGLTTDLHPAYDSDKPSHHAWLAVLEKMAKQLLWIIIPAFAKALCFSADESSIPSSGETDSGAFFGEAGRRNVLLKERKRSKSSVTRWPNPSKSTVRGLMTTRVCFRQTGLHALLLFLVLEKIAKQNNIMQTLSVYMWLLTNPFPFVSNIDIERAVHTFQPRIRLFLT